ncbi:MAG: STAS domain-containing protein, partial [Nitrospinae bacterium]|nr:STAS domain-containing protein [Nitrospinota bacterium]
GHTIAFRIEGNFENAMNQELKKRVLYAFQELNKDVIIDLTQVEKIDARGILFLIECIRVSEVKNSSFKLIGINNKVKAIIERMKLPALFDNTRLSQIPRTNDFMLYRSNFI